MSNFDLRLQQLRSELDTINQSIGDIVEELDDIGAERLDGVQEYCMKLSIDLQDIQTEFESKIDELEQFEEDYQETEDELKVADHMWVATRTEVPAETKAQEILRRLSTLEGKVDLLLNSDDDYI